MKDYVESEADETDEDVDVAPLKLRSEKLEGFFQLGLTQTKEHKQMKIHVKV